MSTETNKEVVREFMRRFSAGSLVELSVAASTPYSRNWPTWSRISEISGETTTVIPGGNSKRVRSAKRPDHA